MVGIIDDLTTVFLRFILPLLFYEGTYIAALFLDHALVGDVNFLDGGIVCGTQQTVVPFWADRIIIMSVGLKVEVKCRGDGCVGLGNLPFEFAVHR